MSRRPIVATAAGMALATLIAARGAPVPAKPPAIPVLVAETTSTGAFLDRDGFRLATPPYAFQFPIDHAAHPSFRS